MEKNFKIIAMVSGQKGNFQNCGLQNSDFKILVFEFLVFKPYYLYNLILNIDFIMGTILLSNKQISKLGKNGDDSSYITFYEKNRKTLKLTFLKIRIMKRTRQKYLQLVRLAANLCNILYSSCAISRRCCLISSISFFSSK